MLIRCLIILFCFNTFTLQGQSVLEKSGVIKIATIEEGVYKIDRSFLQNAGFDIQTLDPHKIQVYGLAGGNLDQRNSIEYFNAPQPLAMLKSADGDNSFEEGEYLAFYADAVDNISYDTSSMNYIYEVNYYSDSLYFFIDTQIEGSQNLIKNAVEQPNSSVNTIDYYDHLFIHDDNRVNILGSGREWYGESFLSQKSRSFSFGLQQDLASNKALNLETHYISQTQNLDEVLSISINDFTTNNLDLRRISTASYAIEGYESVGIGQLPTSLLNGANTINIDLTHEQKGSGRSEGLLDYFILTVPLKLEFDSKTLVIRNREIQELNDFQLKIDNVSSTVKVWELGDPINPKNVSHNEGSFFYTGFETELKFIAFTSQSLNKPIFVDIESNSTFDKASNVDLLVITHPKFQQAAERLASHRTQFSGLSAKVVDVNRIFDHYASGRRDVTAIRNYIRDHYKLANSKLKYVLLVGTGSYVYDDYSSGNTNYVPIYQSRNSLDPTETYSSDDYFALMEESEGFWEESNNEISSLDIGVGRIACKTLEEANNYVEKVIRYDSDASTYGNWRNNLFFVADDEDRGSDVNQYYRDSDQLVQNILDIEGAFNINKIYLGNYEQENFASYQRSPEMRQALDKMNQKGALIVNYIGHGAYNSWTDEAVLTNQMIEKWDNDKSFPIFLTATCEFGRHDSPTLESGAQLLLHKRNAGAIALLTTSRPVYSNTNFDLNQAFYEQVFSRENGEVLTLGEIYRNTKNNSIRGVSNRNFILLGDPSLTIGWAKNHVQVDELISENNQDDTLRARDKVFLTGHIENSNASIQSGFQGEIIVELYDKPQNTSTKDTESTYQYLSYEKVLFRGRASVVNGQFSLSFYMPEEIDYLKKEGKLSFYAVDKNSLESAYGFDSPQVGGSVNLNLGDDEGPEIYSFLNDSTFLPGDKVGADNELFVDLYDDYGISISESKLNKGIYYQIDDEEKVSLNDFFFTDIDSYQRGKINLALPSLSEGSHRIEIGAQDIFNNSSTAFIDFFVVSGESINILDFVAFPNPARTDVTLKYRHNRKNEMSSVRLKILDMSGQVLLSENFEIDDMSHEINWDLSNRQGVKLAEGMYFLMLEIESQMDSSKSRRIKKLIIIN